MRRVDPRPLISRVFSLKDAAKAIRYAQKSGIMKVLLRPDGGAEAKNKMEAR